MKKVKRIKWLLFVLIYFLSQFEGNAQGKYFEVVSEKSRFSFIKYTGDVQPLNNEKYVFLNYPGKTASELYAAIMKYIEKYPSLVVNKRFTTNEMITYREFSKVGDTSKCFADLIGFTMIYAIPENDKVKFRFAVATKIYSTVSHAFLRITPQDDIASDGDVPFNEYKYVQPVDEKYLGGKTVSLKEAYPESVFDENGKVVNPVVKQIIENYYDGYVDGLKYFLDNYFTK